MYGFGRFREDPLEREVRDLKARSAQIKRLRQTKNFAALALMFYHAREDNIARGLPPNHSESAPRASRGSTVTYPRNVQRAPGIKAMIDRFESTRPRAKRPVRFALS